MGIRPNGSGAIPPVTPDNPETRYSDWLTDLEDSGEIVGGVWQETDAKASSGNDGVTDLAGRVAALEAVSSTSGTSWQAWRRSGVTTLTLNGVTDGFTLPAGYRPPGLIYGVFSYAQGSVDARFNILSNGSVQLVGDIPNPAYGTITFVSAT